MLVCFAMPKLSSTQTIYVYYSVLLSIWSRLKKNNIVRYRSLTNCEYAEKSGI